MRRWGKTPTEKTIERNVATVRRTDVNMFLARRRMSMLIPASKRMMQRAITLIRGETERKSSLSKYPSMGPSRIPKPRSQIMSGTLALV